MKNSITFLFILIITLITACAPQSAPSPTQLPAIEPTPLPATAPDTVPATESTPLASSSTAWKEVRDTRYGFGLAVPCWWLVSPIPAEGIGGVMGLANYDETYFRENSNKGYWDWPNGSLKIDIVVLEGINPTLSEADAYMAMVDTSMERLVSTETQQTGTHTAAILTIQNLVNQNDLPVRIFLYRLAPEKLILINPIPQSIIDTPDFQAMLTSIALTSQEQITKPTAAPNATPLIDASCVQ